MAKNKCVIRRCPSCKEILDVKYQKCIFCSGGQYYACPNCGKTYYKKRGLSSEPNCEINKRGGLNGNTN